MYFDCDKNVTFLFKEKSSSYPKSNQMNTSSTFEDFPHNVFENINMNSKKIMYKRTK